MKSPHFTIAGDVELPPEVKQILLVTPLSRYDFVTIGLSEEDEETLLVSRVEPEELATFDGLLFQADSLDDENGVVLREVSLAFWPFEEDVDEDDEEEEDQDQDDDEAEASAEAEEDEGDEEEITDRGFRIVTPKWWREFTQKHRRG